jgi:methyl-accepting chemotaxis protein
MNNKLPALAALLLCVGATTACTDLKPIQADIAQLRSAIEKQNSENATLKSSIDAAAQAASQASQAAQSASAEANRATAAAQTSQQCCDANTERMDRMFRRSVSK